jgi:hypothetical protein
MGVGLFIGGGMTSDREKSTEETILAYKSLWGLEEDSWEEKVISGLMLSRFTFPLTLPRHLQFLICCQSYRASFSEDAPGGISP